MLFFIVCDFVMDWVIGLILGVDDYMIKLFSFEELVVWLCGLLCCFSYLERFVDEVFWVGDFMFDGVSWEVICDGMLILFFLIEFELF